MRVHIALFFVSLLYAILFSWAGQIMPNYLRPEAFVMLRVITATALFYLFSLTQPKDPIQWKAHGWEFAICGFFGTSANMYLFSMALHSPIPSMAPYSCWLHRSLLESSITFASKPAQKPGLFWVHSSPLPPAFGSW